MQLKDYYTILELEPSATMLEIKKAYRRLALQYHPDKNQHDPYAAAQFSEIKEAYEVLTNPSKKEYYLQQRWYNQSLGKRKSQPIITPVTVLLQALELEKYVSKLDVFRMDKEGLKDYILELLPDPVVDQLSQFNEPETIREIIKTVIRALHALPPSYTGGIINQLEKLVAGDQMAITEIRVYLQHTTKRNRRERYSLLLIIAVTVILCLVIYLSGR